MSIPTGCKKWTTDGGCNICTGTYPTKSGCTTNLCVTGGKSECYDTISMLAL